MLHDSKVPDALHASVFVDAHVHLHGCFKLESFLESAARNFAGYASQLAATAPRFVICLTETCGTNEFKSLARRANGGRLDRAPDAMSWRFTGSENQPCVVASHPRHGRMEFVAGRQIVTAERLEVLALGSSVEYADGLAAAEVIEAVIDSGAIPVIPWGFGKWLGRRRRVVQSLIDRFHGRPVYLGDNGGRPRLLPTPPEFEKAIGYGIRTLPGSDPLPFPSEFNRVGSFGFYVEDMEVRDPVWPDLQTLLLRGQGDLKPFGRLESPVRFARNQMAMQYVTRIARRTR